MFLIEGFDKALKDIMPSWLIGWLKCLGITADNLPLWKFLGFFLAVIVIGGWAWLGNIKGRPLVRAIKASVIGGWVWLGNIRMSFKRTLKRIVKMVRSARNA